MIVSIPNQPIVFAEKDTEAGACAVDENTCQIVYQHDKICFQHRQSSCLPQLLCSPSFDSLGPELVTDGDFYTNPYGQGGWDFVEEDWVWTIGTKRMCVSTEGGRSEAVYNLTLDPDCVALRVTFTISELVDNLLVTLPDGTVQNITVEGVYEYILIGPFVPVVKFTPEPTTEACIDDFSVRCISECWVIEPQSETSDMGLTFAFPGICKTDGVGILFTETPGTLTTGKYYQVWADIGSVTAGTVEVFLGGVSIGVLDEEGVYPLYGTSGGTQFSFLMSADFVGCINSFTVYQLTNEFVLTLFTQNDNGLVEIPLNYTRDLLEACIEVTPAFIATFPDFQDTKKNCWKLVLESPDDGELVTNGAMTLAQDEALTDFYLVQDDDNFAIDGVQGAAEYQGGDGYLSQQLTGLVAGNDYYVAFDIVCLRGEVVFDSFAITLGSDSGNTGGTQVFTMDNYPQVIGSYVFKVTAGNDGDYISLYFTDDYGLASMCIRNLSVRTTPCPKETKESNCINYSLIQAAGTKLITACNEEAESMGFDWTTGFKIHGRVPATIVGPRYASPEDDTYLFSDSRRKRVFMRSEKTFDLLIGKVGELTHDWIRAALKCDVLFIESDYPLLNRYVCLDNEYVPQWERKSMPSTAEASVEIQRFDNTIFNTNCG